MPSSFDRELAGLPQRALVAFAVRAARRVVPLIAPTAEPYGPEAWEWLNAAAAAVRVTEAFAGGSAVSRFTLDLAAELPRAAANAVAAAARRAGPSPAIEQAEIAFAVAAFAADAARAATPSRAVQMAAQAATTAAAGSYPVADLMSHDGSTLRILNVEAATGVDPSEAGPLGKLWPAGGPDGWSAVWATLADRSAGLPRLIVLPGE